MVALRGSPDKAVEKHKKGGRHAATALPYSPKYTLVYFINTIFLVCVNEPVFNR